MEPQFKNSFHSLNIVKFALLYKEYTYALYYYMYSSASKKFIEAYSQFSRHSC